MASRHYGEFEILDYSDSMSSFSFNFGAITALSLPGFLAQFGALRAALENIIIGTVSKERWIGDETPLSNIPPIDSSAQRELYWLVTYETEFGGHARRAAVPTPDLSLLVAGTDFPDFANPAIAAFITAFEAIAVDPTRPDDGVIVYDMQMFGRKR